jgi:hypothetical protein
MIAESDAQIWARLIDADSSEIDEASAAALLKLRFRETDIDRMNELAAKEHCLLTSAWRSRVTAVSEIL